MFNLCANIILINQFSLYGGLNNMSKKYCEKFLSIILTIVIVVLSTISCFASGGMIISGETKISAETTAKSMDHAHRLQQHTQPSKGKHTGAHNKPDPDVR